MTCCGLAFGAAAAAGAVLYVHLPPDAIALALGIFFIVTVPVRRLLDHWRFKVGEPGLMAIGAVPVVEGSRLVGIFSERDYARKVALKGLASTSTTVQAIMTSAVQCAGLQDSVMGLMDLMTQRHFRHMPVVEQGRLLGILSIGDLVKAVIEDQHLQIQHLQDYIRA